MNNLNWGVPDWRDAPAYAIDRSSRQWRWEFLRRRWDYREDWLKHYEPGLREALAIYRDIPLPDGVTSWEEHFSGFAVYPDAAWKYGIAPLLDPSRTCSEFELWQASQNEHPYFLHFASREEFEEIESTGRAVVVFDLNIPLGEQVRKAELRLKKSQANVLGRALDRRRHEKKWPLYLRVMDAKAAGETLQSIGFHVLGRIDDAAQHARNALRQATDFKL
jgi:hypothetical protein